MWCCIMEKTSYGFGVLAHKKKCFTEISELSGAQPFSFMSDADVAGLVACTLFSKDTLEHSLCQLKVKHILTWAKKVLCVCVLPFQVHSSRTLVGVFFLMQPAHFICNIQDTEKERISYQFLRKVSWFGLDHRSTTHLSTLRSGNFLSQLALGMGAQLVTGHIETSNHSHLVTNTPLSCLS